MMRLLAQVLFLTLIGYCTSDYTDPHCDGKQVIVHLFEWKWSDIATECEQFLSKKGYCGVQISPANEHLVKTSNPPYPWWQRYQPISYKLDSRSGTKAELMDMIQRCKKVGVRIYVDVILNHMAGLGQSGVGSAGSSFNSDNYDFPGVPYTREHFHKHCEIRNYGDPNEVRNCFLVALTDLDQSNEYVRNKIAEDLNQFIDIGVAGFRTDAAKHMWPADMNAIEQKVKDLPEGGRPFFAHEVIDQGGEPIKTSEYTSLGYVTEFRYCIKLGEGVQNFGNFDNAVDFGWGMTSSDHALVFVDNHDNQRSHGGGGHIITHKTPRDYKMASAFMLANDYGFTRVMSSYQFGSDTEQGPPHNSDGSTKTVQFNADGSCRDGWVCEHRWASIANMVAFRNAVVGTNKENYFNQNNQIAFSRGNKGFFAMARDGHMDATLQTGLPAGEYCDLITDCATKVTVDGSGMAHIVINNYEEPIVAFIVGGATSSQTGGTGTNAPSVVTSAPVPVNTTGWSRTVILMEKQTAPGQDLFIRGGLDHGTHSGCNTNAGNSACAIPIKARNLGTSAHFAKYNAWSMGDTHLDWYGAEPGQGRYHGVMAQGSPAVWTTNVAGHPGYNPLNTYGEHYWLLDVDMDCSKTDNGWFELKGIVNSQWESNVHSMSCSGASSPPTSTSNHWAKCGDINVYHFDSNSCEIKAFS